MKKGTMVQMMQVIAALQTLRNENKDIYPQYLDTSLSEIQENLIFELIKDDDCYKTGDL